MNKKEYSIPIDLTRIKVTDPFWKSEIELVRKEVIPYQWEALNDRIPEAAPSYCMRNFKMAAKLTEQKKQQGADFQQTIRSTEGWETLPKDSDHMEDRFYGYVFQDSDFAKWIEAVGYSLTQHPDPELEKVADGAIDIVCSAQQENGYLDTYYILNDPSRIFTNLRDKHELYCFGHLTEGAIAYYQATGKDKLLRAVERYADYIFSCFGPEEGKKKGYPGHEIAEMALVRLYEVTRNRRYLELSEFFLNQRGTKPYYFDQEIENQEQEPAKAEELRYAYYQSHLPVREQDEVMGHSVRAVYLYSGMADVARLTEDEKMYLACQKLWENMTEKKMYLTGGIGATHMGEAFSFNYDLPNDTAYAETCASIGLVFFARRMLEIQADSKYADIMERALYNGVLSGMALDGKSFFYVNPLEVLPEACHKDERKFHVKPVRQKWFGCACCPPNLARLISSIGSYAYTETEDTVYLHLYMGGEIKKQIGDAKMNLEIKSNFPWDGKVEIAVKADASLPFTLALRIPSWCDSYTIDGKEGLKTGLVQEDHVQMEVKNGYLYLTKVWNPGETLTLDFPMETRFMQADPKVREDIGKTALMRGPIVYCMEEADNGTGLAQYQLLTDQMPKAEISTEFGGPVTILRAKAKKLITDRIEETESTSLYRTYQKPEYQETEVKLIPYYSWANRGEGEMMVWVDAE